MQRPPPTSPRITRQPTSNVAMPFDHARDHNGAISSHLVFLLHDFPRVRTLKFLEIGFEPSKVHMPQLIAIRESEPQKRRAQSASHCHDRTSLIRSHLAIGCGAGLPINGRMILEPKQRDFCAKDRNAHPKTTQSRFAPVRIAPYAHLLHAPPLYIRRTQNSGPGAKSVLGARKMTRS